MALTDYVESVNYQGPDSTPGEGAKAPHRGSRIQSTPREQGC